FEPRVNHIRERIQLVENALQKLRTSENLRQMLEVILAVGNFLNYGTARGNAYGFHLDPALDMIDGLKANDKSMSLLVFVIEQMHTACPDALKWIDEFELLADASKGIYIY
ncbi:actin binding protein, partial [Reticulomyxa filosa]